MNQSSPTISAIVISWEGMSFLPDCLATLTADLEPMSHELIIIDNGSTDGSVDFIKTNYPHAKLVANDQNLGFARAVNQGIETASGEYLYILNQDLRFRPGTARALLNRLQSDSTIGLIGPKFVGFDGRLQKTARAFPRYRHVIYRAFFLDRLFSTHREFASLRMGWFDHNAEAFVDQPMGAAMMIPRRVVDQVGLMDEQFWLLFNDVDYCRRIKMAGYRLLYYPEAVVEHYVGGSTKRIPYKLKAISHMSLYRYLRKYARPIGYPALWLCGLILMIGLPILWVGAWLKRIIAPGTSS